MVNRTQIILLRHGQTDFNAEQRFQGQLDMPLNQKGRDQAHIAAGPVSALGVDAIYASPLQRAYVTAQALAHKTDLPIITDKRLEEINVGSWEGKLLADIRRDNPQFANAISEGRDFRRSPTGETCAEVGARMAEAIQEIAANHAGQTIVVASHGLAIRMGTAGVLGWDYKTSESLGGMWNCGWTILEERDNRRWKLVRWNQSAEQLLD